MGIAVKIINKTRYFFKKYIIKKFRITSDRLDSISSNLLLIEIYYLFFNRSFRREKQSVLKGIVSFQKKSNGDIYNQSLLTRNIHRIEKGLIMKNTKNIFALDYIEETIKEYKKIKGHTNEIVYFKWYTDVLEKYFSVVDGNHPIIHKLYNEFKENKIEFNTDSSSIKSIPRKKQNLSNIDFEEFYKLNMQRRSVRWFEDIKVPRV
jgi:carboxypeptidase C (cathepsin A)